MAKKTKAYVDTSAFIAFLDHSDSHQPLFGQLFSDPPPLITTSLVIAEGHGWFLKRYDATRALQYLSFIEELKLLHMIPVGRKEIEESTRLVRHFSDQDLTLTDACGLWIMKSQGIHVCWSTDRHLSLTGVPLVIHEIP